MSLSTKRLREYLAEAEQHVAETKAHVACQRQIVKELANKEPLREEAVQMLAILEDTPRILEQHCGLIRSWLKEGQVTTLFVSRAQRERW
jgi:hypothetical protein